MGGRRWLTVSRVKLPKSFVAVNLSDAFAFEEHEHEHEHEHAETDSDTAAAAETSSRQADAPEEQDLLSPEEGQAE